jgi:hypothetical protein
LLVAQKADDAIAHGQESQSSGETTISASELLAWVTDNCCLEICGDDSVIHATTEEGMVLLGFHEGPEKLVDAFNKFTPWSTKIEGFVVHDHTKPLSERLRRFPPMVSRTMHVEGGYAWRILHRVNRTMKRWVSYEHNRSHSLEEELRMAVPLANPLVFLWFRQGRIASPAMHMWSINNAQDPTFMGPCLKAWRERVTGLHDHAMRYGYCLTREGDA